MCDEKTPLKIIEFEEFLFNKISFLENSISEKFNLSNINNGYAFRDGYLAAYKEIFKKFIADIYPDRERSMRNE